MKVFSVFSFFLTRVNSFSIEVGSKFKINLTVFLYYSFSRSYLTFSVKCEMLNLNPECIECLFSYLRISFHMNSHRIDP